MSEQLLMKKKILVKLFHYCQQQQSLAAFTLFEKFTYKIVIYKK